MNLHQLANRSGVPMRYLRKLDRMKALRLDTEDPAHPEAEAIRFSLANRNQLSAAHLCALIEDDSIAAHLGAYADAALDQVASVGQAEREKATPAIVALVEGAAKGDADAIADLVDWIQSVLPAAPVSHHYLAVRLLLGAGPNLRGYIADRIPRAFLNCRQSPRMADWWTAKIVKRRKVIFYRQGPKISFDL